MLNLLEFHPFERRPAKQKSSSPIGETTLLRGFQTHSDLVQHFDLGLLSLRQLACCPALAVTDGQKCN